jgi:hypothetical protein
LILVQALVSKAVPTNAANAAPRPNREIITKFS